VGTVVETCIAPTAGAQPVTVETALALSGAGLEGDRYAARAGFWDDERVSRDLTLIELEAVEAVHREKGIVLAARDARRNVVTRGIGLNALVGETFRVGEALCLGTELCEPCKHPEDVTRLPLLRPLVHRGGLRARILQGAGIAVGDEIRPVSTHELALSRRRSAP
jgi:MOSC domain-containing protein YiiM